MPIWVDADACPIPVKEILYRAAHRAQVVTTLVANQGLRVPPSPFIKTQQVEKGFDVADHVIAQQVKPGDLVITGEGRIDFQTVHGKTPIGVARVAKRHGIPVIGIAGSLGADVGVVHAHGIDAVFSVLYTICSLEDALDNASENVQLAARNIAAVLKVGQGLKR